MISRDVIDALFRGLVEPALSESSRLRALSEDELDTARVWFREAGIELEKLSDAALASLAEAQFRDFETGRGPGIVEVLGPDAVLALELLCQHEGKRDPDHQKFNTRGCRHVCADLVLYVRTGDTQYLDRINRRIWKGLRRIHSGKAEQLAQIFVGIEPPDGAFAGVFSGETVWKVWLFLTDRYDPE